MTEKIFEDLLVFLMFLAMIGFIYFSMTHEKKGK